MNLLERDDFKACLTGCIRTEQTESGLLLHRHTEKQIAYYAETSESWSIRSRCTAGISLNIRTDSRTLDLVGRIQAGARNYAGFDVEVDGRAIAAIRMNTSDETQTIRLFDFETQAERQVSITFPQSAIVELDAITVEDDSQTSPPSPAPRKYLALGDSITQGMDARGPASAYVVQLARMLDTELLNLGVGGHIFDLDALDDDLPYKPDIVTIAYGTNDWTRGTTREQILNTVERYLSRLLDTVAGSADVYVLTPIWRAIGQEAKPGGTLIEFSSAIAEVASGFPDITIVDGTTLVPHRDDLLPGGTHPNDEGFLHYALNLHRTIS
jgi:lysophospholipase L1-like esterase